MRHLNDGLLLAMFGMLVMLCVAAATVRWMLLRKQKRKSRGNAHWIDVGARSDADATRSHLGSRDEPR